VARSEGEGGVDIWVGVLVGTTSIFGMHWMLEMNALIHEIGIAQLVCTRFANFKRSSFPTLIIASYPFWK